MDRSAPFVRKNYEIVSDPQTDLIIRWASACSFVITNPQEFQLQVLPLYFRHSNLSSYSRQLNTYGFKKIPNIEGLEFRHANFLRDDPSTLCHVRRRNKAYNTFPRPNEVRNAPDLFAPVLAQMGQRQSICEHNINSVVQQLQDTQQSIHGLTMSSPNIIQSSTIHSSTYNQSDEYWSIPYPPDRVQYEVPRETHTQPNPSSSPQDELAYWLQQFDTSHLF